MKDVSPVRSYAHYRFEQVFVILKEREREINFHSSCNSSCRPFKTVWQSKPYSIEENGIFIRKRSLQCWWNKLPFNSCLITADAFELVKRLTTSSAVWPSSFRISALIPHWNGKRQNKQYSKHGLHTPELWSLLRELLGHHFIYLSHKCYYIYRYILIYSQLGGWGKNRLLLRQ